MASNENWQNLVWIKINLTQGNESFTKPISKERISWVWAVSVSKDISENINKSLNHMIWNKFPDSFYCSAKGL